MIPIGGMTNLKWEGMDVICIQDTITPAFKVSKDVPMTEEFRKIIDLWCYKTFGGTVTNVIDDDKIIRMSGKLLVNPRMLDILREKLKELPMFENKRQKFI